MDRQVSIFYWEGGGEGGRVEKNNVDLGGFDFKFLLDEMNSPFSSFVILEWKWGEIRG